MILYQVYCIEMSFAWLGGHSVELRSLVMLVQELATMTDVCATLDIWRDVSCALNQEILLVPFNTCHICHRAQLVRFQLRTLALSETILDDSIRLLDGKKVHIFVAVTDCAW